MDEPEETGDIGKTTKSEFLAYLSLIIGKKIPFVLAAFDPATGTDFYKTHGGWGCRRGLAENLLDMVKIECDMIQMFEVDDESEE